MQRAASMSGRSRPQQQRAHITAKLRGPVYSNVGEGSIVIDIGTRTVKVGVVGDITPSLVMPTPQRLADLLLVQTVRQRGGIVGGVSEDNVGGDVIQYPQKVGVGNAMLCGGKVLVPAKIPLPNATLKAATNSSQIISASAVGENSNADEVDVASLMEEEVNSLLSTIATKVPLIGNNKTPIFLQDVDCNPQLAAAVKAYLGSRVDSFGLVNFQKNNQTYLEAISSKNQSQPSLQRAASLRRSVSNVRGSGLLGAAASSMTTSASTNNFRAGGGGQNNNNNNNVDPLASTQSGSSTNVNNGIAIAVGKIDGAAYLTHLVPATGIHGGPASNGNGSSVAGTNPHNKFSVNNYGNTQQCDDLIPFTGDAQCSEQPNATSMLNNSTTTRGTSRRQSLSTAPQRQTFNESVRSFSNVRNSTTIPQQQLAAAFQRYGNDDDDFGRVVRTPSRGSRQPSPSLRPAANPTFADEHEGGGVTTLPADSASLRQALEATVSVVSYGAARGGAFSSRGASGAIPLLQQAKQALVATPTPSNSVSHYYYKNTKHPQAGDKAEGDDTSPVRFVPSVNSNPVVSRNVCAPSNAVLSLSLQAAALNAYGFRSGLVLDLGWKSSRVCPIIHNCCDKQLSSNCFWGMSNIIHILKRQIIEANPQPKITEKLLTDDILQNFILQFGVVAPPVGHPKREAVLNAKYPIVLKTNIVFGKPNLALEALFTGCLLVPNGCSKESETVRAAISAANAPTNANNARPCIMDLFLSACLLPNLKKNGDELFAGAAAHSTLIGQLQSTGLSAEGNYSQKPLLLSYKEGILSSILQSLLLCHPWYNLSEAGSVIVLTGCLAAVPNLHKRLATVLAGIQANLLATATLKEKIINPIAESASSLMVARSNPKQDKNPKQTPSGLPNHTLLHSLSLLTGNTSASEVFSSIFSGSNIAMSGSVGTAYRMALEDMYVSACRKLSGSALGPNKTFSSQQSLEAIILCCVASAVGHEKSSAKAGQPQRCINPLSGDMMMAVAEAKIKGVLECIKIIPPTIALSPSGSNLSVASTEYPYLAAGKVLPSVAAIVGALTAYGT